MTSPPSVSGSAPWFDVVLHEPEIPNNTGSIGRTCVALASRLHLVHPLGFEIDEKAVRRAGLDYWPDLMLAEHADWASCRRALTAPDPAAPASGDRRVWALSRHGSRSIFDAPLGLGDAFVFGRESTGLPAPITEEFAEREALLALPMAPGVRSINLSNAVAAVLYEAVRRALGEQALMLDSDGALCRSSQVRI